MRVLHLLSNRKWTERSEPAADLAVGQQAAGCDVTFVCGRWKEEQGRESSVEEQARRKGLAPVVLEFEKHFRLRSALRDLPRLRALLDGGRYDVIHVHLDNAHLLAALALRGQARRPLIVKSLYEAEHLSGGLRTRHLYRHWTDGLAVISEAARADALRLFSWPPERIAVVEPGIDLARFQPRPADREARREFAIPASDLVVGIVSRLRKDRRLDLALTALQQVQHHLRNLRLLVVGHGEEEQALRAQADALGLADRVTWAGYCRGDRLVAAYQAMDTLFYPVPGTDPSCRTVREGLACGIPVIATEQGFLKVLLTDQETGLFSALDTMAVAAAFEKLANQPALLAAMKTRCAAEARARFDPLAQARKTMVFYESLRTAGRPGKNAAA